MMPTSEIALATSDRDVAAVQDLMREYIFWLTRTHPLDVAYQDFEGEMADFPARYEALLLARVERAAAGACALKRLDAERCELKRLYVRPAFRGLGLGEGLTQRIMDEARTRGYRRMVLDTHEELKSAIAMYQGMGFTPSEPHNEPGNVGTLFFGRDL